MNTKKHSSLKICFKCYTLNQNATKFCICCGFQFYYKKIKAKIVDGERCGETIKVSENLIEQGYIVLKVSEDEWARHYFYIGCQGEYILSQNPRF